MRRPQMSGVEVGGWWTEPLFPVDEPVTDATLSDGRLFAAGWPVPGRAWQWCVPADGAELDTFAVTVARAVETPAGLAAMTMKFGQFLFELRQSRQLIPGRVDLGTVAPVERPGLVALPHLTTVIDRAGRTGDQVIWESLAGDRFSQWLAGTDAGTLDWVKVHLGELKALRALARTGQLGASAEARRLRHVMGNRFLSVRAVCQNVELIEGLVEQLWPPSRTPRHTDDRGPR